MNHIITGAAFADPKSTDVKQHPVMHMAIEVCGVKINAAIWPQQVAKNGTTKYWPVTGDYQRDETRRLVDVTPTFGLCGEANTKQQPAENPAPASDGDYPF